MAWGSGSKKQNCLKGLKKGISRNPKKKKEHLKKKRGNGRKKGLGQVRLRVKITGQSNKHPSPGRTTILTTRRGVRGYS